jgi:DNA-binding transcriptional LysR family regulator
MNTDAVAAFLAVADEGQFQRAADRLGISQQATSKRVAALEAELGTALFQRVPAGAVLTQDGRAFRPHAHAVMAAVGAAVQSVQPGSRPLRVDVLARGTGPFDLVRGFLSAHPEVPVTLVTGGGAAAAVRAALAGEIDAGFGYLRGGAGEAGPRLRTAYSYLEPAEVIAAAGHPLARGGPGQARLADLARYPAWIPGIVPGSEWQSFYQELSAEFGLDIDPTGYVSGAESVFDAIAASESLVTFVGAKSRVALPPGAPLVRLPVVDPVPLYPWSVIWRRQGHPGIRRLVRYARRAFVAPAPDACWLPRQARDDLRPGTGQPVRADRNPMVSLPR